MCMTGRSLVFHSQCTPTYVYELLQQLYSDLHLSILARPCLRKQTNFYDTKCAYFKEYVSNNNIIRLKSLSINCR